MKGSWSTGWWNQQYLGNFLWSSVLVRVAISYQTLLSQTQLKPLLLQVSLRSGIIVFNNNLVFCQAGFLKPFVISFCSMPWVAGWFPLRKIIKRTSVFHPVCLKKYNKKLDKHLWLLFRESCMITHHSQLKVNQTLC